MSIRQYNLGSIVKPGFNPLGAQTSTTFYDLYSWGANGSGQLGLGNTTTYSSPKQIGALTDWQNIACGGTGHYIYQNRRDNLVMGIKFLWYAWLRK